MSKFLVTYHGAEMPHDPELMAQARAAFGAWLQQSGSAVTDPGAPLKFVTQLSKDGMGNGKIEIGGYSIIEASDADEVEKILSSHPFIGRGGVLQVNELIAA